MTATKVPMRLSPLHALHLETGAVMSDVAGWQVVQRYGDVEGELSAVMESAGVCDISGRTAVRIKSSQLDDVLGERSPAVGMIIKNGDSVIARLTREEALVFGPSSAVGNYPAGVEPDGDPVRYLTAVTSPEEVKRGGSIQTSLISIVEDDTKINFLDTPGYDDFLGEVVSAMRVVEGAVIVISAPTGVDVPCGLT